MIALLERIHAGHSVAWRDGAKEPLEGAAERLELEAEADGIVLDGDVWDELVAWLKTQDEADLEGEHLKAYRKYVKKVHQ